MTPIEVATERLKKAIDRLERAAARLPRGEAEQPRLNFGRSSGDADPAALQKMADGIASRLDSAIGRLKLMLEG
jgi:hypothetical protein